MNAAGPWTRTGRTARPPTAAGGSTSANRPTSVRNTYIRETVALAFATSALGVAMDWAAVVSELVDRGMIIECGTTGLRLAERPDPAIPRRR